MKRATIKTNCPRCSSDDTTHTVDRKDVAYTQRYYYVLHHKCNVCGVTWESVERPKQ